MTRTKDHGDRSAQLIPIAAIGAGVALAAVVALTAFGGSPRNDNGGGGGAGSVPTPASTPNPTDAPSVAPATPDGGSDAMPITVALENATGAGVYVDIVDETGLLVDAASGTPGVGVSVESYTLQVENVDATTLKLTWIDYPIDNALALYILESEGGIRLVLVQPEPTGPTDAMGFDRELILTFSQPVSADQVDAFLQDGLDVPA